MNVEIHAYKAQLDLAVRGTNHKRPTVTIARLGAVERIGKKSGVDERVSLGDEAFEMKFDLQTEAPAAALAALFEPRGARKATFALDELHALPVWIADSSVGISHTVGVKDLAKDRIVAIVSALCALESSLGTWEARQEHTLRGEDGRRLVRRAPRASRIAPLLDWSPLGAFVGSVLMIFVWMALPGYGMESAMGVFAVIAVVIAIVTFAYSVRALRGEKNALVRSLVRTFGVAILVSHVAFFALHAFNRSGGPSRVESVHVVEVEPPRGKGSGWTKFTRANDSRVYKIATGWRSRVGAPFRLVIHDGRLGWPWAEYAE